MQRYNEINRKWRRDRIISAHLGGIHDLAEIVNTYVGKEFFSLVPHGFFSTSKIHITKRCDSAYVISAIMQCNPSAFTVVLLTPRKMQLEVDHCECCWNKRVDTIAECRKRAYVGICPFTELQWFSSRIFCRDKTFIPEPTGRTPWTEFWRIYQENSK